MKNTIFLTLSLIALLGIIVSSIIMINQNGMNQRLQGWVNLLWIPLPIFIIIIDRINVRKYDTNKVNKAEFYILGSLLLLFVINWIRLQQQK